MNRLLSAVLTAAAALLVAAPNAIAAGQVSTPGTPIEIQPAVRVTWDQMVRAASARTNAPVVRRVDRDLFIEPRGEVFPGPPSPEFDALHRAQLDAIAARRNAVERGGACVPLIDPNDPMDPVIKDSRNFEAAPELGFGIPSDASGAAGPNHLVSMTSEQIRIQTRTGELIGSLLLQSFWAEALEPGEFVLDPYVLYDELDDRFVAIGLVPYLEATEDVPEIEGKILYGISDSDDPTAGWTVYAIEADLQDPDELFPDELRVGYNNKWHAITANMFGVGTDLFNGAAMWVIDKNESLVPGGPITVYTFEVGFDFGTFQGAWMTPASTHDPAEDTLWIIDSIGFSIGFEQLHRLSRLVGPANDPIWLTVPSQTGEGLFFACFDNVNDPPERISQYSLITPDAPQRIDGDPPMDIPLLLNATGARILDADFQVGREGGPSKLWYCHMGGLPGFFPDRTAAFWAAVDPLTDLVAEFSACVHGGFIDVPGVPPDPEDEDDPGTPAEFFLYPSLAVNCNEDMMIAFTRSSEEIFAQAAYAFRPGGDDTEVGPVTPFRLGDDTYLKTLGLDDIRWGDHSSTVLDPLNPRCFWTIQTFASNDTGMEPDDDRWSTQWARLCTPGPEPPLEFQLLFPGDGDTGVPADLVVVWEQSVGADSYTIQIDESQDFDDSMEPLVYEFTVADPMATMHPVDPTALAPATTYYCRVFATNAAGSTFAFPNPAMFTTSDDGPTALGPFEITSPADPPPNDTLSSGPTIEWTASANAVQYLIEFDYRGNFSDGPDASATVFAPATNVTLPPGTLFNSTDQFTQSCRVRIIARKPDGTTRLNQEGPVLFNVSVAGAGPESFTLVSPDEGAEVSTRPLLVWNNAVGALFYRVQIALMDEFELVAPLAEFPQFPNAVSPTDAQVPQGILAPSTQYYWRVIAIDAENQETVSASRSFMTNSDPPSTCVADVNGDGMTDVADFAVIASAFGTTPLDADWNPTADLNGDGVINVFDFQIFAEDFGCVS